MESLIPTEKVQVNVGIRSCYPCASQPMRASRNPGRSPRPPVELTGRLHGGSQKTAPAKAPLIKRAKSSVSPTQPELTEAAILISDDIAAKKEDLP
jgi:hypothetical protein